MPEQAELGKAFKAAARQIFEAMKGFVDSLNKVLGSIRIWALRSGGLKGWRLHQAIWMTQNPGYRRYRSRRLRYMNTRAS